MVDLPCINVTIQPEQQVAFIHKLKAHFWSASEHGISAHVNELKKVSVPLARKKYRSIDAPWEPIE